MVVKHILVFPTFTLQLELEKRATCLTGRRHLAPTSRDLYSEGGPPWWAGVESE
jgi:hypothetical protein